MGDNRGTTQTFREGSVDILGPVDAMKVRSCMTLFDIVSPGDVFSQVLEMFYDGRRCARTIAMITERK